LARLFFNSEGCRGATSGATGREYNADRQGFINVTDPTDIKALKAGGYIEAGGMPRISKFYVCECGWEAAISHCPKCDRDDLTKVEK